MRRRIRDSSVTLDAVLACARTLQEYRASQGYGGRLDERVGKLDANERWIVDLLLTEGRNVTHVARTKSGAQTPDLVVDGEH